jgi:alpha-galactosidase
MSKPGSQEYYDSLIALFAQWGVDYIKVDDVSRPYNAATIEALRKAIGRCGRQIVLSLSPGPAPLEQAEHVKRHAELWRASHDLWDTWADDRGFAGLHAAFELAAAWAPHAGPGHWADLDMLPLGRISMRGQRGEDRFCRLTPDEQRAMMTLWCIARAPLMWGGDPLSLDDLTLSLLTNEEALAVLNGSSGNRQLVRTDDTVVWVADADGGGEYVALFNVGDGGPVKIAVELAALGLGKPCAVRDLWAHEDRAPTDGTLAASVPEHGAALFRVTPAT